jgi:hypothetical protein
VKRSADDPVIPDDPHESFEMLNPQLGIRMVKAQERPARPPRACVQLRSARGLVTSNQSDFSPMPKLPELFGGLDGCNHPFRGRRLDRDTVHQAEDKIVIAPDRNDQADKRAVHGILSVTVITSGSSRSVSCTLERHGRVGVSSYPKLRKVPCERTPSAANMVSDRRGSER